MKSKVKFNELTYLCSFFFFNRTKYVNNIVDRMEEVNTLFSQQSLQ